MSSSLTSFCACYSLLLRTRDNVVLALGGEDALVSPSSASHRDRLCFFFVRVHGETVCVEVPPDEVGNRHVDGVTETVSPSCIVVRTSRGVVSVVGTTEEATEAVLGGANVKRHLAAAAAECGGSLSRPSS